MFHRGRERKCLLILVCIFIISLIEIAECSKKSKIAKAVVKTAVERKLHKSHSKRFPTWAIVLLVLAGLSGFLCAVGALVYCLWRRGNMRACFPTPV